MTTTAALPATITVVPPVTRATLKATRCQKNRRGCYRADGGPVCAGCELRHQLRAAAVESPGLQLIRRGVAMLTAAREVLLQYLDAEHGDECGCPWCLWLTADSRGLAKRTAAEVSHAAWLIERVTDFVGCDLPRSWEQVRADAEAILGHAIPDDADDEDDDGDAADDGLQDAATTAALSTAADVDPLPAIGAAPPIRFREFLR